MADKNYYEVLGVDRKASEADIKKAYRKLVRKYHPDVSDDPNADAKIAEINNAYETLKNADKRAEYDAMLDNPFANGQGFSGFGGQGSGQGGFNFEDIFSQFGGQGSGQGGGSFRFEDIFSQFGGQQRGRQSGFHQQNQGFDGFGFDQKGQDQHAEIDVDLDAVYHGKEYSIKLNVPVRQANGALGHEEKTLKIKIPKGITEGKQIRLAKQGAVGVGRGENGDLFLKVKITHADNIRVEGADVYQTVNVAPWEAALGEKITVNTPAGQLSVTLPKNTQAGRNLRLKGKGIPAKQAGDLYLTIKIVNPTIETDAQQDAFEALKNAFADQPIAR